MNEPVIITNPARCRDCYRCVRHCDVKAIRVQDGQAQVVPELCIVCTTCIRTCPQKAKDVPSAMPDIKQALKDGRRLIASVAPSAPAYFHFRHFDEMESALKKLGFPPRKRPPWEPRSWAWPTGTMLNECRRAVR